MAEHYAEVKPHTVRVVARPLTTEELADCCGGCRMGSAIETWMQRAIAKFCEVNGIPLGVDGSKP